MPFDATSAQPVDAQTPIPASGFDPGTAQAVAAPGFKFSNEAISKSVETPGQSVVYMHPAQYLALTPDLPTNARTDKKGASLKKSLAKGDDVDEIPSLHVTVGKDGTGKVVDQDGRHRALFAQRAGIDLIPVAISRGGDKARLQKVLGMREGSHPIDFDFPSVAPKSAPGPKPKVGFGGETVQGFKDPYLGAIQLGAHGVEALAKGGEAIGVLPKGSGDEVAAFVSARDAGLDRHEAAYQAGRREQAGGKDPGFDYGRLTGNIVNPINALPVGEAGAVARAGIFAKRAEPVITGLVRGIAKSAASTGSGGAVLAALNPVTEGDFWDEKTKQAAVGLAAGTVVPPVFKAGSNAVIKAGSATVAPIVNWMAGVKGPNATLTAAEKEVMRRLSQGVAGGGPTAQDMLDLAARTPDKPLTLLDVGSEPVNSLGGRVYRSGGEAKQQIGNALVDRVHAQQGRLNADVAKGLSGDNAYTTEKAMEQSRANAAAPLYQKFYDANPAMVSPTIDRILETPAGKQALSAARVKMQNDLTKMGGADPELAEQMREAGQQVPKGGVAAGLSGRTLDYVKRSFDDMIGAKLRSGEKDDARILTDRKRELVAAMDAADSSLKAGPNSERPEGGFYKQARAAYSGPSQSLDALDFGRNALKPGTVMEENADHFKGLNPNDQEFARLGLAQSIRDLIRTKDIGTNAARKLAKNPDVQERVRPFFRSDAAYQKFMDSVTAEDNMFHAVRRTIGGSDTAARLGEDNDADAKALGHAAQAGIHAASGNHLAFLSSMLRGVSEYAKRPNPELAHEMSKLLTAPLNQQGSAGMKLLRDFSSVAPGTRNYLAQANNRAARASLVPGVIAAGPNGPKP